MKLFDSLHPVKALTILLEKERASLLSGDFKALHKLDATKEALMKAVARGPQKPKELDRLKNLTERNRRLLLASARGIKSARLRISHLHAKPTALNTYGPSGGITQIDGNPLTIKKKA